MGFQFFFKTNKQTLRFKVAVIFRFISSTRQFSTRYVGDMIPVCKKGHLLPFYKMLACIYYFSLVLKCVAFRSEVNVLVF